MEMGGGGNIVEGPRQYLQGTLGRSAGGPPSAETSASTAGASPGTAPTAANTCNNLSLDDARPVSMETTPNPLSYWPPPSAVAVTAAAAAAADDDDGDDSPFNDSCKDARDEGLGMERLRKSSPLDHRHHSDRSYPSVDSLRTTSWIQSQSNSFVETDSPAPALSKTHHNLPPIAAITSSHNYRGVREAHHRQSADHPSDGKPPDRLPDNETTATKKEDTKPNADASEFSFARPSAVHPHAGSASKAGAPLPRAPTPFVAADHRPYRVAPEAPTLNATAASGVSSLGIPPSHYAGSSPAPSRLPVPSTASSPSSSCDTPRLLSSPLANPSKAPSPAPLSRLRSSPHADTTSSRPGLSSPSAERNPPPMRLSTSPRRSPLPSTDSIPRYSPAVPYPNYPYLSSSRPSSKPVPSPPSVDPRTVLPTRGHSVRSNLGDAHCRNPFEIPPSKSPHYPQQPPQQLPHQPLSSYGTYAHAKPGTYYPHPKPGEKDCDAFKRAQQPSPVQPKGPYPTDGLRYDRQQQPQSPRPPLSHSSPGQIQQDSNGCRPGEVRQWTKTDRSEPETWSYYSVHAKPGLNRVNQTHPELTRGPGTLAHRDAQNTAPSQRQPNGSLYPGVGFHHPETGSDNPAAQISALGQRYPPVPQSNYDLNREIYDRMTGGNQRQPQHRHRFPTQQNQHLPPDKASPQMPKPQPTKSHPYYRDSPPIPASDKEKKSYSEFQMDGSRPHARFGYPSEQAGTVVDVERSRPCPLPTGDASRVHHTSEHVYRHHRPTTQGGYSVVDVREPGQEATPTEYNGSPFANPQTVQSAAKPPRPIPNAAVARPKRESPLDLSVKTVRQSADSTAKDDAEMYPHNFRALIASESRYQMGNGPTASAPKIDFTPDFSGFNAETHPKVETAPSALPSVDSFKKTAPPHDDPRIHSAVTDIRHERTLHSSSKPNAEPPHRHYRFQQEKVDYQFPEKRPSTEPIGGKSSLPKLPKIDAWRLAMDQQIEQRLNSARPSQKLSSFASEPLVDSSGTVMTSTATTTTAPASDRCRNARTTAAHPKPPVQTSAAPYDPSSYLHRPQCRPTTPQTPQDDVPHRDGLGHSPDPEQIIKQISEGVMPDRKLLQDKNVVSILRSSLEEKEAKLIQLREAARRKEKLKEQQQQQQDPGKKCIPTNDQTHRLGFPAGKQSLPPFGAIALERTCSQVPFAPRKVDVLRSADAASAEVEPARNYLSPTVKQEAEKSGIPSLDPSPQDDAQGPPTDLDGLAAFLAARIRTKAELKQVGPTSDNLRVLSSRPSPEASTGVVNSLTNGAETPSQSSTLSASSTTGNPPKLQRESRLNPPFRRRLFSHAEDEASGTAVTSAGDVAVEGRPVTTGVPSREPGGIRSSSETSVFDFRESDSEGEMPVLERQTLEGMRRDRRTFSSKQNVSTTTPDDPLEAGPKPAEPERIAELETCEPDPFWNAAFDMFVEQLEKRPPKRSVRRKGPRWRPRTTKSDTPGKEDEDGIPLASEPISGSDGDRAKDDDPRGEAPREESEQVRDGSGASGSGADANDRTRSCEEKEDVRETVTVESGVKVEQEEEVEMEEDYGETEGEEEEAPMERDKEEEKRTEKAGASASQQRKKAEAEERGKESEKGKTDTRKEGKRKEARDSPHPGTLGSTRRARVTRANRHAEEESASRFDSDLDSQMDLKSDSSSVVGEDEDDDDDSVSVSEMESESTDSDDEGSNAESLSDSDDSDSDSEVGDSRNRRVRMRTRMQTRTSRQLRTTGMRLRSKAVPVPKAKPRKCAKRKRKRRRRRRKKRKDEEESHASPGGKRKKPSFGDGSYFRPGWEEECYKFKQQLRMPEKLISISRPPKRSAASLPDLDPYRNSPSMSLDSSDVSLAKKVESENDGDDFESKRHKPKKSGCSGGASARGSEPASDGAAPPPSLLTLRNGKKSRADSILNLLVNKYGRLSRRKHGIASKAISERKSPRILPKGSDKPELLPTPSLGIGKENVLKDRRKGKDSTKRKPDETESIYLGYFRRKTVNNFKEAFKEKGGLLPDEFGPEILESRTRMQTKVLKKRATLVEVFGEERPASAPPLSRCGGRDVPSDGEKPPEKKKAPRQAATSPERIPAGVVTRGKGTATRCGRPGLRSAAVLRSNRAVQISKRHLNCSRRQRNIDLIRLRAMAGEKLRESEDRPADGSRPQLAAARKRLKLRSARRKFRSGFDYIRKKKKMKKDGDSIDGSVKEKKAIAPRPNSESIADIQSEMKNWVINKGLGETVLHRAARLGYTDVAAYCLEKMDCSPSPRDNAGYTPLHEACSRGHLDIAKLLLMYGASVSESAKGGIRPLHEAAENGFTELIRLLLSYGADPLLETYTGHTALSLVTDEDARRLIQHHLADVQGNVAPPWTFNGPATFFDPVESGCDPLEEPPSPEASHSEFEVEACENAFPPLYRLADDFPEREPWVLVRDVVACSKGKSRDVVVKQLTGSSSREMKVSEFVEKAKCCNLLGGVWSGVGSNKASSRVVLVPYDEKVRQLMGVERVFV